MTRLRVNGPSGTHVPLSGTVAVPGDKSISHRALMLGALADGTSRVEGFLPSGDCLATVGCLRQLGVEIEHPVAGDATTAIVYGRGLRGLVAPEDPLDCRRSGTTIRLLAGILAGQTFDSVLSGAPQLLRRPMRRITQPLAAMGAEIADIEGRAPLSITGGRPLRGGGHVLSVASAQVKSCILLAGLYADDEVSVQLPGPARDHTERMIAAQAEAENALTYDACAARIDPAAVGALRATDRVVPGDISSAAFLIAAASAVPGSDVAIPSVGVNPTRTGLLDVLQRMGAKVELSAACDQGGEPVADIDVRASTLSATEVRGETVVRMIDEFPILAVQATQAVGRTEVRDAAELRVKETDRIAVVVEALSAMGASIEATPDGFVVEGPTPLTGAEVDSQGDHRVAMALAVAGLIARGQTTVLGAECIPDSFPGFVEILSSLGAVLRYED